MEAGKEASNSENADRRPLEFKFEDHGVRVVRIENEPWFVAGDICDVLQVKNSSDAIARLDDDERGVVLTETSAGPREVAVVNEFGLYSLVLSSRKPQAKAFKRWVTHEVLPAIRKTGRYETQANSGWQNGHGSELSEAIEFPQEPGRYVLMVRPDRPAQLVQTDLEIFIQEDDRITAQYLCHEIRSIAILWHKICTYELILGEARKTRDFETLNRKIADADASATRFLRSLEREEREAQV